MKVYDRFNEAPLDPTRWIEGDKVFVNQLALP
jgi:hypothetical protein